MASVFASQTYRRDRRGVGRTGRGSPPHTMQEGLGGRSRLAGFTKLFMAHSPAVGRRRPGVNDIMSGREQTVARRSPPLKRGGHEEIRNSSLR